MAILLALAAATGWGASDYFGGDAARRDTPVFVVVAVANLLGLLLLVPLLVARGAPAGSNGPRLLLAAVAGLAVTVELSLVYRALSRGQAFITATTGALGTAMAVTIGLISGDPFDVLVGLGLICALLGGGISAWHSPGAEVRGGPGPSETVAICLGAAAAVGTMLTALHAAGRMDPYWATAAEHASTGASAGVAAVVVARRPGHGIVPRRPRLPTHGILPRRPQLPALALVAAVGVGGDLAYTGASHLGGLSVVSAIASLYPVTTIGLGRVLRHHRATRIQLIGIILALCGAAILGAATR
jgi:drug/metabolite transporter (DMT)-like permease